MRLGVSPGRSRSGRRSPDHLRPGATSETAACARVLGRLCPPRLTRIASDGVEDNEAGLLAVTAGGTSRLRLLVEGSRPFRFGGTRLLTPTLELGVRRDGGDAETGTGIDLGGSLRYADAALGLTAEASGRYLVTHEDAAYREWGASASVRIDPGTPGRGLTLSVMPSWARPRPAGPSACGRCATRAGWRATASTRRCGCRRTSATACPRSAAGAR